MGWRRHRFRACGAKDGRGLKGAHGAWIFGHAHERSDAMVGDCRLINAAPGYPWEMDDTRVVRVEVERWG